MPWDKATRNAYMRTYMQKYREKHKDQDTIYHREYLRKWIKMNPEKWAAYRLKYVVERLEED